MAQRDTAARRYAEAAFEVAQRDGTVEAWRSELDAAGEIAADDQVGRMLANPAVALETRTEMAESIFGKTVSKPVLNLIGADAPARPDRAAAPRRRRVPTSRQRPPGHHPCHRHQRRAAEPGRGPGSDRADGSS